MYIMQLVHIKNIDEKKYTSKFDNNTNNILAENLGDKKIEDTPLEKNTTNQIKNQLKSINQIKTSPLKSSTKDVQENKIEITSFQDLIDQANRTKEIELKYDL